jgi:hypothetical protein
MDPLQKKPPGGWSFDYAQDNKKLKGTNAYQELKKASQ